ncbi:MAG: DNA polymerase I [Pseudomonadota bacterium]
MKTLFIIDGSSYFYRAFHAIKPLTTKEGIPTNAIYGFTVMLMRIIKEHDPSHICIAFDHPSKSFRHDIYSAYKANRSAMPDELRVQIPYIKKLVQGLNICAIEKEGFEADDIIGTLTKNYEHEMKVTIVSGDKDLMQLVNEKTNMLDTMKDKLYGPKEVLEKFGVGPELIIDYLAMVGDSSDNVPGISGIGAKSAVKFINQFGNLEKLFENADNIKGKISENIKNEKEKAILSKQLVTLNTEMTLDVSENDLEKKEINSEALSKLFNKLEFKRFLTEIEGMKQKTKLDQSKYYCITEAEKLNNLCKKMDAAKIISVDLESTSVFPMEAKLVGVSISLDEGNESYYLPINHLTLEKQLDESLVLEKIKPSLENKAIKKIGQNLKYDFIILQRYGILINPISFDTMIASYLLNPGVSQHNLDAISLNYLGHKTTKFEDVVGKGVKQIGFAEVDLEKASHYACEDSHIPALLYNELLKLLKEDKQDTVFSEIELPLLSVLAYLETNGVLINTNHLESLHKIFSEKASIIKKQIFELASEEFNINSPKQLSVILYDKLNYPVLKKTKTGKSTDLSVLEQLSSDYELPRKILDYRSLTKLISTYIEALPRLINHETGRIHTSFNQTVTATGRLSSSDPNLQNIPIRSEDGKKIREAFIAPKGYKLVSCDYSQIELRILAHFSNDPSLIDAYKNNLDIHKKTASEIFGIAFDDVTDQQRSYAKTINFGIIYGMSAFRLSNELKIPHALAKEYIDNYFRNYSKIKNYIDRTLESARKNGYVSTLFGRRRYLPDLNAKNMQIRMSAERIAINTPIQGTAADIIKVAMINIYKDIINKDLDCKMIIQVHDELVFEIKNELAQEQAQKIKDIMENACLLAVPITVNIGIADNWAEAH